MQEEKLNFTKLSNEVESEIKNDYKSKIQYYDNITTPMFKILLDYFNLMNDKKNLQKKHGISIYGFVDSSDNMIENLPELPDGYVKCKVILKYNDDFVFFVRLSREFMDGCWICSLKISSSKQSYVSSAFLYKKILFDAISISKLKGSYFTMKSDEMFWDKIRLEKRDFSDIYLPEKTMQDLKLYTELFLKKGELMRYLLAGTPGTGKTEATIAIANVLNKLGVTVIKTSVCGLIKEKIELAELLEPSIVIFDDIDLSLGSRNSGGFSHLLGTFLDVMDGTDKISKRVGIIATSNSLELLDLAASRPGRFNKLMTFDEITKDNIKNLISKSIKYNFNFSKNHISYKLFTNDKIINFLHDSKQTGSWIFNNVEMVIRKIEVLELKKYDLNFILEEFEDILSTTKKITNSRYLQNGELKGESNSKKIGFSRLEENRLIKEGEIY